MSNGITYCKEYHRQVHKKISANNQILVKKHKGEWLVFDDIMAESWSEDNELYEKDAYSFKSFGGAYSKAEELEKEAWEEGYPVEYGIKIDLLAKDLSEVKII